MKKVNFVENEAFENKINIQLFNEIVNFVISTTNIDAYNSIRQIKENFIWFKKDINESIQDKYGVKYFGEMLERFEEKVDGSVETIRAIALAVACIKNLITENMVVGTQLVDFINKIKQIANNDLY